MTFIDMRLAVRFQTQLRRSVQLESLTDVCFATPVFHRFAK
jgi:hypothetical protein